MPHDIVREFVSKTLNEYSTRFDLVEIQVRLRVKAAAKEDPQVPDIMTNIRVLKGVSTARQTAPIKRIGRGRDILDLSIKYMPEHPNPIKYVQNIGRELRQIEGIEIVKILSVGGQEFRRPSGDPYVF